MPITDQLKSDPKLKHIGDRMQHTIEISMERVAAHLKDPGKYPLPADTKSVERAMHNLLSLLPERKRKKFIEAHEERLTAGAAKRHQWYGDLADVDFKSTDSITEQVKLKPLPVAKKITEENYKWYKAVLSGSAAEQAASARRAKATAASVPGSKVAFTMLDLTCNKKSEIGKDEISIGAFFVDSLGKETTVDVFEVGDFKKGTTIPFAANSPLSGVGFEIIQDVFPQTFIGSFFLLEKDLLRNSKVTKAISIVLEAIFITASAVIIATGIAFLITSNVVLAIITLIAFIVFMGSKILLKVLDYLTDDFSDVASDVLVFDTLPNAGDVFNRSAEFTLFNGDAGIFDNAGKYTANFKWEVF